ncbi:MAG: hypothetical protein ABJQ70_19260 [Roseobacter sp.]
MSDLLELWLLWQHGPLEKELILWGKPLWWWSRFGTLVQVIAIIGLGFELAGYDRIRNAATALASTRLFRRLERQYPPVNHLYRETYWETAFAFAGRVAGNIVLFAFGCAISAFLVWLAAFSFRYAFLTPVSSNTGPILAFFLAVLKLPSGLLSFISAAGALGALSSLLGSAVYAVLVVFFSVFGSPQLKALLNFAILAATLFNLHFALLTQ